MKAIILAAGIGNRLGELSAGRPKCLLEFNGKSLLSRHIHNLEENKIDELLVVTGYRCKDIENEIAKYSGKMKIATAYNSDYRLGSIISLYTARDWLSTEEDFLLMDADVLYARAILSRLVDSHHNNVFLLDRDFIPGDEPVKLCVYNGTLVDFRKKIADELVFDDQGESVGFFKFSSDIGHKLIQQAEKYLQDGRNNEPYEELIRDLLLEYPQAFFYEDITGLPWLEIDFPEDVERAKQEILPKIEDK